jgi:prevent-host-death family protein
MLPAEKLETEEIALGKAKVAFFDLVAKVESNGSEVILTRHGKPVAKLVPVKPPQRKKVEFGCLKDFVTVIDEDLSLEEDAWGELHDAEGEPYGHP